MKSKNYKNISEEDFLKNKAKRKGTSDNKQKKKKKSKSPVKAFLLTFAIIIGIGVLVFIAALGILKLWVSGDPDEHENTHSEFINAEGETVSRAEDGKGTKKYFTFLATATDAGESLTDVIMVARFKYDDKEPEVSILQIPRDTFVKISSEKLHFNTDGTLSQANFTSPSANHAIKINEAYFRGKNLAGETIDSLLAEADGKSEAEIKNLLSEKAYIFLDADIEKVKKYASSTDKAERKQLDKDIRRDFGLKYLQTLIYYNFGIPTDYRAQVNIAGFRGIVNAIDGVDLYISQPMHYEDPYQDLYIHFNPGQHHLNGKKAEEFVRFRGYPGGDVQRLDAQKLFIDAFMDKLLSFSTITKIDDIVSEVQKNLYTNISFNNLLKFANKSLSLDIKNDVKMFTLPGIGEYIGPVSYFVADRDGVIELVNKEFNVFNTSLIDEDFCVIASESIYRPPVSVDTSDNNGDDEEDEETENGENTDEEDGDETQGGADDDTVKNTNSDDGEADDNADTNNNSETDDENGSSEKAPSNADDTAPLDGEATEGNKDDTTEPEKEEVDENYQLLLDMAA